MIGFCFDLESFFAPLREPSWVHVGSQDAPKRPQGAAGTALGRRRDALGPPQEAAKTTQEAPRSRRALQDRFLVDFGWIFNRFLTDADRFLADFSLIVDYIFRVFF